MDAEKILGRMLNDEFELEVLKEALEFVQYDEDVTREATYRLNNGWVRKSNGWTNEMVHKPSSSL